MTLYDYRCEDDGIFEVRRPLGTAPSTVACPLCASEARRVYASPMLTSTPPGLVAALDHEEKTRHEPDVVTSLPPRPAHQRTRVLPLTPTFRRLPRP